MLESLEKLYRGETLSLAESQALFEVVLRGEMDPIVLSSLLTALKIKGESPSEIAGAASALAVTTPMGGSWFGSPTKISR